VDSALGGIRLRSHQTEAVRRILAAIDAHGGALLADAPGLGKTFVALAVARVFGGATVAAPAALRGQWRQAADLAGVRTTFHSLESLSRHPAATNASLLIIDEAHHLRNPRTRRYTSVARLAACRKVLLLSATPVHNRHSDLEALLSLFLGVADCDPGTLAQVIVRRTAHRALLPTRGAVRWLTVPGAVDLREALAALPPPLPASDGRAAAALVRLTLAHAWSSSLAALDDALRRALHHAGAVNDALAEGRWPTRAELRAWLVSAESSQLAFPLLVASPATRDLAAARNAMQAHTRALTTLRQRFTTNPAGDAAARACLLRAVLAAHPGETVIAFAHYAATVDALWQALRLDAGVVALTSRGVRSAGGGLRRADVLAALSNDRALDHRAPLRLVLSTDLLGEGLDLRAVSVIVHLDQPWTPARLDQREGRAMRLGVLHPRVAVFAFRPPPGAARMLALSRRLRGKRRAMGEGTAPGDWQESLRELVRPWLGASPSRRRIAAVRAPRAGWVAVLHHEHGHARILVRDDDGASESPERVLRALRSVRASNEVHADPATVRAARAELRAWRAAQRSFALSGAGSAATTERRNLMRRLDAGICAAPLHERGRLMARLNEVRSHVLALRGAGVEQALREASSLASPDQMLDALETLSRPDVKRPTGRRTHLLALLLLIPDE
jgi:hypothetical protein